MHTSPSPSVAESPVAAAPCLPSAGAPKPIATYDGRGLRKFAIMGGAYGNVPALTACIAHAQAAGCEGWAFIGDSTGCCGHSDETISLIRSQFTFLVAGNHEQKAATNAIDCGCNYTSAEDEHYGSLAHQWAMQSLSNENRAWLGTWPDLAVVETAAGRLLLCHGSPAQTNEFLYESQLREDRLLAWLDAFGAQGLLCTHSGFSWVRELPGGRFAANVGVCGKPDHDHDVAVHYVTVTLGASLGFEVQIERVEYDHLGWADQLDRENVDDVFTIPIRNGVWTCGLLSMPSTERVLRPRPVGWLAAVRRKEAAAAAPVAAVV